MTLLTIEYKIELRENESNSIHYNFTIVIKVDLYVSTYQIWDQQWRFLFLAHSILYMS